MSQSLSMRWLCAAVVAGLMLTAMLGLPVAVAQDSGPPTTVDVVPTVVFLAAADSFADALPASAVAGSLGAPLLLTPGKDLGEAAEAVLRRRAPGLVVLVGGTAVLTDQVAADVEALGLQTRR
ncbi:cell wall-binding repeat-containing protein, partial [Euzebya pacifica]|uniref:cell wall-binding repeat-containing protein n=1 Tax=Euzebya pacifica TaxID=1608957 RepID=UPI0030F8267D